MKIVDIDTRSHPHPSAKIYTTTTAGQRSAHVATITTPAHFYDFETDEGYDEDMALSDVIETLRLLGFSILHKPLRNLERPGIYRTSITTHPLSERSTKS